MTRIGPPVLALAAAGLVAMAGCGEKRSTSTGAGSSGGSSSLSVSETEFKLTPAALKVKSAGQVTIQVKNDGTTVHALELKTATGEVKTGSLAPGKSATLKADLKAGSYTMYCPIDGHRAQGMEGKVVVGSGGGGSSGGGGRSYGGGGY